MPHYDRLKYAAMFGEQLEVRRVLPLIMGQPPGESRAWHLGDACNAAIRGDHPACLWQVLEAMTTAEVEAYLVERGYTSFGHNALAMACEGKGSLECVEILLHAGAAAKQCRLAKDDFGRLAIQRACFPGKPAILRLLLQQSADVVHAQVYAFSLAYDDLPLSKSVRSGSVECVQLLLRYRYSREVLEWLLAALANWWHAELGEGVCKRMRDLLQAQLGGV